MPKDEPVLNLQNPPLDQRVSYRISRLNARLNAQAARILKESADISLSQWRVMVMIDSDGEISASEIVRRTKIDKSLVSRTIKSLLDQGLIETLASQGDQRTHLIRLTMPGRERFKLAWPKMLKRHLALIDGVSQDDLELFFATLAQIERAIDLTEDKA